MKIRIGVGAAGASATPAALADLVTGIDELGFDSLWLSEVLTGPVLDPVVGLAWAAASNPRVKLGTTMLLPGRHVLRLAKQLASLDVLCHGRLLVTLVPGLTYPPEREAIGVEPKRRGTFIDEALPLVRRLWAGETLSHEGVAGNFRDVTLSPLPVQQPLEVWLGGTAPAGLARSSSHRWGCRRCVRSSSASSPWASRSSSCVRWPRRHPGGPSSRPCRQRSATSRPDDGAGRAAVHETRPGSGRLANARRGREPAP